MKFAGDRPFADPDNAARQLVELANAVEADRDQRIAIELINAPFLQWRVLESCLLPRAQVWQLQASAPPTLGPFLLCAAMVVRPSGGLHIRPMASMMSCAFYCIPCSVARIFKLKL